MPSIEASSTSVRRKHRMLKSFAPVVDGDPMDARYLNAIKTFEGYSERAKWDYAQYTNGYGTRARHAGEIISRPEAERRFAEEIARAAALVEKFKPDLEPGTRAALTSLTFNAGPKWMTSGLGAAIRAGDLEEGRRIFLRYDKAGGEVLPGLQQRRMEEARWFDFEPPGPAPSDVPVAVWRTTEHQTPSVPVGGPEAIAPSQSPVEADTVDVIAAFEAIRIEQWRFLTLYGVDVKTVDKRSEVA
ncbi:MAG: lysozyme [Hyphomicrobium sp.]|nr:lysozyme [Hyphomicrobium sp.]